MADSTHITASRQARRLLALASTIILTVIVGAALAGDSQLAEAAPGVRPNIILIVTDDQRRDAFDKRTMPAARRLIAKKGTVFTDAIVTTPTCCPSRATILTGQYGHNNGVLANAPGYRSFRDPDNTLPVWLQQAGYRTAHLGKYLNGYQGVADPDTEVAPGWDEWHTLLTPRRYYDYRLAVNGKRRKYGRKDRDHLTRVLNRRTTQLIRRFSETDDPFYIQLDQFAPHTESGTSRGGIRCKGAAVPAPRDASLFRKAKLRKKPSFNENDVGDKPSFIRGRERLDASTRKSLKKRHGCQLASLRGVDRGVRQIVKTLKKEKELGETAIMFMSDNGFFLGEHRIAINKTFPYEEATRVPLAMRVPPRLIGGTATAKVGNLVANLDIAPTILELAGAEPCNGSGCRVMDGRSLVGLLRGIEGGFPGERAVVVEYGRNRDKPELLCAYAGIRDPRMVYVEYTGLGAGARCRSIDEGELYNLAADPFQLHNLFRPGAARNSAQAALDRKLEELRKCSGIAGRDAQPTEGSFCE